MSIGIRRSILVGASITVLVMLGTFSWLFFPVFNNAPLTFSVSPGSSIRHFAATLHQRHYLRAPILVEVLIRLSGGEIKAGEYALAGQSRIQFLRNVMKGNTYQHSFTLVEGWTSEQVLEALRAHSAIRHTFDNGSSVEKALAIEHLDGAFLAETYYFEKNNTDIELLHRAHELLKSTLSAVWKQGCNATLSDENDLLVLASLVEKEAFIQDEKPVIAGVLHKRLASRMRLQVDPSVYFALKKPFTESLTREDLRTQSPYNTYAVHGLPPKPISMVSERTLQASCIGHQNPYLYYVAKGDGTHAFSENFQDHQKAVQMMLKTRAKAKGKDNESTREMAND